MYTNVFDVKYTSMWERVINNSITAQEAVLWIMWF